MNKLLALFCVAFLVGCSGSPKVRPIEITTDERKIEQLHPPLPPGVVWQEVEWKVLTPDIMRELLAELDQGELDDNELVFVALRAQGYENLALNIAELRRYIEDTNAIIGYYREIPEEVLEQVEETKKEEEPVEESSTE